MLKYLDYTCHSDRDDEGYIWDYLEAANKNYFSLISGIP